MGRDLGRGLKFERGAEPRLRTHQREKALRRGLGGVMFKPGVGLLLRKWRGSTWKGGLWSVEFWSLEVRL